MLVPVVMKAPVPEDLPPRALLVRNHLQSIRHGPCWRCAELDLYFSQAGMAAAASDSCWGCSITVLCHRHSTAAILSYYCNHIDQDDDVQLCGSDHTPMTLRLPFTAQYARFASAAGDGA
jgi:hypothetical protein